MDRRVTPPKRVTSPTWGPPPPCKQALSEKLLICKQFFLFRHANKIHFHKKDFEKPRFESESFWSSEMT